MKNKEKRRNCNLLIANFIGYSPNKIAANGKIIGISQIPKYHKSWDLLVPCVIKASEIIDNAKIKEGKDEEQIYYNKKINNLQKHFGYIYGIDKKSISELYNDLIYAIIFIDKYKLNE